MRLAGLTAYAVSCFLLHHVLQHHYFQMCRSSIFSAFTLGSSPYCTFVDNSLRVLQWSPLLAAAPLLQQNNFLA